MSRFVSRYLLLFVFAFLLLALAACVPTEFPRIMCPAAKPTPEPVVEAWGAAVLAPAAAANLHLLAIADELLVYQSFDVLSGDMPDGTAAEAVLALEESAATPGSYVLYTALPITDAASWHEYAWFAGEEASLGSEIALSDGLPISSTVSYSLDGSDGTLGASYGLLSFAGWNSTQTRRLLLRDAAGAYQLILLECPPGEDCQGSPAPGNQFCGWCNRCSRRWCSPCRRVC